MTKRRAKDRMPPAVILDDASGIPLDPSVLRDLGLRCLVGDKLGGAVPARRVFRIENIQSVKRWLFVYIPSASNEDLKNLEMNVEQFGEPFPIHPSRKNYVLEAPLTEFGRCNMSHKAKRKQKKEREPLTLQELVHDKHLLGYVGYPNTGLKLDAQPGSNKAFALDCEMCRAGTKRVLTRIAIVDFHSEKVLLDTFVKPAEPITDYVTVFSGITPEKLEGVTTTLSDIQQWLRDNVGSSDILVGHSLESDLSVLEVDHERCVDTTLLFPHHKGLPMRSSLKYLAKKFLNLEIQGASTLEKPGHDPIEDTVTCIKLVKLKLELGHSFGDTSRTVPLSKVLSDNGVKSTIVGQGVPYWDAYGTADAISVIDDTEGVSKTLKALNTSGFVFTTLSDPDLKNLGTSLSILATDAPANTLLTVWNGVGNLEKVRGLLARRHRTKEEYATKKWDEIKDPWTDTDNKQLTEAEIEARSGTAFIVITGGSPMSEAANSGGDFAEDSPSHSPKSEVNGEHSQG